MITSWTISQLLRLRHAKAEAKAHAVTDSVASAQDVAAMFRTSDALRLLCLANAWAEETILYLLELPLSWAHASLEVMAGAAAFEQQSGRSLSEIWLSHINARPRLSTL